MKVSAYVFVFGFALSVANASVVSPESQGVSSRAITDWIEACEATAATNGFRGGYLHGFVILRHGKVIAEGTWAPQVTLNERLKRKCTTLALPLEDSHPAVFEGLDSALAERTVDGWSLVKDGRRLAVGNGVWKVTDRAFTDDMVEPLFGECGTRKIAANGTVDTNGCLAVSWQMLGGIRHGRFTVTRQKQ